jgi:hypothetical protein
MSKKRQRDNSNKYLNCPLTKKRINRSVVLVDDGYSYEKEAIEDWFKKNNTSQVTGKIIESKECIENFLLQAIINGEEYEFNCPISSETMFDPVLIITGHTFDRVSIKKHFLKKNTNPLTNEILTNTRLIPNNTIRNLIYDSLDNYKYKKKHKISEIIEFLTRIDNLEILDVIKEMSSSYEKNHNMYMKLCKVVEKYIEKNNKNKLKNDIINAGCIKYIMDIITFYNKNYSDCESETSFYECFYICASNILVLLSSNKKSLYENKIIDANGINVIISAIEHNINNTTIIVSMCMILYNLSKTFSKLVDKIIDANGINVIMHIIKKYDKNIELLQYTNDILGNLANTENNMKKISLAGAIEYVIKTITVQKIKNMNKVIRSGCRTLEKFIIYNNVKSSISIDCINNVIIQNISDPYILVHALPIISSLLNLETQDLIENKILNKDIFFKIIKKYLNNKNNSVLIVSTSFTILYTMNKYNSCLNNSYSYIVIIPIIDAMKQFQIDENIQCIGIDIMLYHVKQKKITNDIFATRDGVYVLITAINIHINNTEIVNGALKILDFLIEKNENTINIINSYYGIGIIKIIKVLKNLLLVIKDNNFEDLLFVCLLIEKLCKSSILYDRIITGDGLKIILLIIQKHKDDTKINILLELFNKLYNKNSLSDNTNKKELQIIDINTIIYIMKKYENDISVQISGYEILAKWYMISSDRHNLFVDLGIFNIIVKAIKTYKNNDILQTIIYDILALFISRIGQGEIKNVFEKEGITLLIKEICENSKNSLMRNNACKLFAYLCIFNDKIKQDYFCDKGFIEYGIGVLQEYNTCVLQEYNTCVLQEYNTCVFQEDENNYACHLLANISWNNEKNINKIVEYECIKTVLIRIQNSKKKNIQKWPLILLNNLIQNEDNYFEFALAGGIQIIVNIMNNNKDCKYIHYILKLLSQVSKVEKLVTTIITTESINCLLEFINTSKISIVHEYVSEIMINLIKEQYIINELKDIEVIKLSEDFLTKETLDRYNIIFTTVKNS